MLQLASTSGPTILRKYLNAFFYYNYEEKCTLILYSINIVYFSFPTLCRIVWAVLSCIKSSNDFLPVLMTKSMSSFYIKVLVASRYRSWHRWQFCRRYRWHWWQICPVENWWKNLPTHVVDTGGAPWLANISANFQKNRNAPNGLFWGWGETDSWKKNQKQKISWHGHFKIFFRDDEGPDSWPGTCQEGQEQSPVSLPRFSFVSTLLQLFVSVSVVSWHSALTQLNKLTCTCGPPPERWP